MRLDALNAAGAAVVVMACGVAPAQVEVRGMPGVLDAEIVRIAPSGVEVRLSDAAAAGSPWGSDAKVRMIGWDRVRLVRGPRAAEAAPMADLADGLWRARARLERQDRRAAELLFDALLQRHPGLSGPSGAVLAEGVVRTRLARGARATAIEPWLQWLNIRYATGQRQREGWIGGTIAGPAIMDPASGLCPRLAPIFSLLDDATGVRLLAEAATWAKVSDADPAVREIAGLYRASAAFEADPSITPALPDFQSTEDHVVLIGEIVRSRVGDAETRREARTRLARRVAAIAVAGEDALGGDDAATSAGTPAAMSDGRALEAWCRAAIGRSWLREFGPAEVRRGVVEMLHVPARLADATPELARLVLLDAAEALHRIGEVDAARTLREEAQQRFGAGYTEDAEPTLDQWTPGGAPPDEHDPGVDGQGAR